MATDGSHDGGGRLKIAREHHVGGDEALVDRCVVAGAEERPDQACSILKRVALAVILRRLRSPSGLSSETVGKRADVAIRLISRHHHVIGKLEDSFHRLNPAILRKETGIIGGSVVIR